MGSPTTRSAGLEETRGFSRLHTLAGEGLPKAAGLFEPRATGDSYGWFRTVFLISWRYSIKFVAHRSGLAVTSP